MARVRVRQHVNPLSKKYQTPLIIPDWSLIYPNMEQPLQIDIGCARGRFLLAMAQIHPQINFLGIEIREPLVKEANSLAHQLGLTNLYYIFANINISGKVLLESLPAHRLNYIYIQFPDPWFKKRHQKRRVLQAEIAALLTQHLVSDGIIFIQSDIETVAVEMSDRLEKQPQLQRQHQDKWLENNPLPVETEREKATLAKGQPVYRAMFKKL